jgi:hypothetical protein
MGRRRGIVVIVVKVDRGPAQARFFFVAFLWVGPRARRHTHAGRED